jgi:ABC-type transport system involved in multi-copper enzyme maturation permease subunit
MYGIFGSMFIAFAIMIIMQRAVVGEKKDGTAAWLLSKPVTHSAFIVSRMAANSLGILLTSTNVPGILVYITAGLLTDLGWLSPLGYVAGILCFCLQAFFWLMLTLMMGTFFDSTGSVIAVPIGLYFFLWFAPGVIPSLIYINPLVLTFAEPTIMDSLAISFMTGTPVYSWIPLITTVILCIVFIGVSIWRFNKTEF